MTEDGVTRNSGASPDPCTLTPRQREVIHWIVQEYIDTGEPVASRIIARRQGSLSPASIRNVMADLSDEGYLAQPHTSAGRIPTAKAFRVYVQCLQSRVSAASSVDHLRRQLYEAASISDQVVLASHTLMEMTRRLGIAAALPAPAQTLQHIELIALPDRRVLMVVATSDRMVRNRVVHVEAGLTQDDLALIRNYVNGTFQGWPLPAIRREIERRLEQDSAMHQELLRKLQVLYGMGLLNLDEDAELHVEGAGNLVHEELLQAEEAVRGLLRALEQKKAVIQLLDRFLEGEPGEVTIQVGLGGVHPGLDSLSLIGMNLVLPGGLRAKMAVMGPVRMNYERAISAVLHLGKALQ